MRISLIEGVFAQIHATVAWPGSVFLTKLAVVQAAEPLHLGLLAAIGQFSQVFQPLGALLTRRATSRKRSVLLLAGIGRGCVLAYAFAAAWLHPPLALTVVLSVLFASTACQAIAGNAWIAWISDMVPREIRGRFFARRAQVLLVAGLLTGLALGGIVDLHEHGTLTVLGLLRLSMRPEHLRECLAVLFAFAALIGLVGLRILALQPERPKPPEDLTATAMLGKPFRDPTFRRLLVYGCWWMLAVGVGAPFWQPFMITKLKMTMLHIQLYGLTSSLASLVVLGPWGRFIDRFGNKAGMRVAIVLGGINPLVWVFVTPAHWRLLYVEAVTSGIMWAGAGIIAMNFVLAIAPEDQRQVYSGLYGACTGVAVMITMLASGAFLPPGLSVGPLHLEPEQVLFALTGILRWTTLIPLGLIAEPAVRRPEGPLRYLWQFAKVRVLWRAGLGQRATRLTGDH